ncbi:MAG: LamB/YcsF family protein [Austwickia sp.]|nr:LamB/YcsF family protein [Austwickia sp.]MBK8437126.1 LamB/YcsF family protein [Austwickia sp.]MBK9102361.1 LamB/YcsF family protein [Austwickia sp.]
MSALSGPRAVDLNADLGESFGTWRLGDDAAMLDIVTSANVACGFHAGDPLTLEETCTQAAARGVRIGAQVGYRDLAGFGRRFIDATPRELTADVLYQLGALDGMCRAAGTSVSYLKPHGALYNTVVHHQEQAAAVVEAVLRYDDRLPVLGLPGSVFLSTAERAGLTVVREAFADRGYTPQGTLVSRREPGALLHDPQEVAARMVRLVTEGVLTAVDGSDVPVQAESICTHGDSPGAVEMARAVRAALTAAGVDILAFT